MENLISNGNLLSYNQVNNYFGELISPHYFKKSTGEIRHGFQLIVDYFRLKKTMETINFKSILN